jgi:hypothetical protein
MSGSPERRVRGTFDPRLTSSRMARIEAVVAVLVLSGVAAVSILVWRIPGPLVVQAEDDRREGLMGATVRCTGPGGRTFEGITDVFGEAKWPGLDKGRWDCVAVPPDRFQGAAETGFAFVGARTPAFVHVRFPRPARLSLELRRPKGQPRAAMAVRALCEAVAATQTSPAATATGWEVRASPLGGPTELWIPAGRVCRAGLVHAALPEAKAGLALKPELECAALPCTGELRGTVGGQVEALLEPTVEQWASARPAAP